MTTTKKKAPVPASGMPTALRLSEALIADLDRAVAAITREAPAGLEITRSDAVRVLLAEALSARRARGAL